MKKFAILMVGRDGTLPRNLKGALHRRGFEILEFSDERDALRGFQYGNPDLVIIGSSENAAEEQLGLARQIRQLDKKTPLILIASASTEDLAIAALRIGINDYFKLPFSFEELMTAIHQFLSDRATIRLAKESKKASNLIDDRRLVGGSAVIEEIKAYISKVSTVESNVLITGETGTGKDLMAELIHRNSRRCHKPLICINSAAIPDGLLESELFGYEQGAFTGAQSLNEGKLKLADGGTVFFDEIGDMSPYAQAKILRAIESKQFQRLGGKENISLNIRVIAATNQDLEKSMADGKFRKDLFFRLNVARIHLPPLRDRLEDIPSLIDYYLRELNRQYDRRIEGFSDDALEVLLRYDYPGNVRELKNLLEAAFVNTSTRRISFSDLPVELRALRKDAEALAQAESDRLLSALSSTNWNRREAARKLRWSRTTLYRKISKYHITTSSDKPQDGLPARIQPAKIPSE